MEKERQQVENDAEWFRAEPWRFCPGEIVFILDADKKAKIGRVDCVRLNYCPDREQGKNPDADTRWPIYVFGVEPKKRRQWIPNEHIVGTVDKVTDLDNFLEENNVQLNGNDSSLKKAIDEVRAHPLNEFQFSLNLQESKVPEKVQEYTDNFTKWFYYDNDNVPLLNSWLDLKSAILSTTLNKHGSSMVVDAFGAEEDPVQVFSDKALVKISQCDIDDYVGCYYGDQQHYIGRIIKKEPFKVQVQFYRKKRSKSKTPKNANDQIYSVMKNDKDFINVKRQGYIYLHIKKTDLEKQREPNGDQNFKLKNNQPFDEFHTQQLNLWLVHKTQLELKTSQ